MAAFTNASSFENNNQNIHRLKLGAIAQQYVVSVVVENYCGISTSQTIVREILGSW